jgi:hypothetical protein
MEGHLVRMLLLTATLLAVSSPALANREDRVRTPYHACTNDYGAQLGNEEECLRIARQMRWKQRNAWRRGEVIVPPPRPGFDCWQVLGNCRDHSRPPAR